MAEPAAFSTNESPFAEHFRLFYDALFASVQDPATRVLWVGAFERYAAAQGHAFQLSDEDAELWRSAPPGQRRPGTWRSALRSLVSALRVRFPQLDHACGPRLSDFIHLTIASGFDDTPTFAAIRLHPYRLLPDNPAQFRDDGSIHFPASQREARHFQQLADLHLRFEHLAERVQQGPEVSSAELLQLVFGELVPDQREQLERFAEVAPGKRRGGRPPKGPVFENREAFLNAVVPIVRSLSQSRGREPTKEEVAELMYGGFGYDDPAQKFHRELQRWQLDWETLKKVALEAGF